MKKRSKTALSVLIAGILVFASSVRSEEVNIVASPVSEQIYMISGKGGNIGAFIGEDGTFLIDDQFAPLTEKIVAVIKSIGGDHPKFLINTHYHGDHTGGNEKLGKGGTLIFSHDMVRERLKSGSFIKAFNKKREGLPPVGLPVVTFSENISFHMNGDHVLAIHVANAHTDGDSFIVFEKANVIHAGDFFFNGFYPFIDVDHGGSLPGMIRAVDKVLAMADEKTRVIPGHGPLGMKKDLQEYRRMLATAHERLKKLKSQGKTLEEALEADPLEDLDDDWGDGLFTSDEWIGLIYDDV